MNLLRMNTVLLLLFFFVLNFIQPVFAQSNSTPTPTGTVRPKGDRKQTLNFEDELVEGSAQKPELFYLFQKKNFNYKRLIKLRENFLPEMRRTTEDIQRLRGGR